LSRRGPRAFAAPTLAGIASTLSIATLLGCDGDGKSNRVKLTERLGCASSYVARSSDALGIEETGHCVFRGAGFRSPPSWITVLATTTSA